MTCPGKGARGANDLQARLLVCGDEMERLRAAIRAASGLPIKLRGPQPAYMERLGLKLLNAGYRVVPVRARSKVPIHENWPRFGAMRMDVHAKLLQHAPKASIGIDW